MASKFAEVDTPQEVAKRRPGAQNPITLLDGGMGRTICMYGLPHGEGTLFRKLWAAAALADAKYHDLNVKAHIAFIEAGSQIITTNSYATQPNYYIECYGEEKYEVKMLAHAKVILLQSNLGYVNFSVSKTWLT